MSYNIYRASISKPNEQKLLGESDAPTPEEAIREAREALGGLVTNLEAVEVDR